MKKLIIYLKRKPFIKNVIILSTGTAAAQLVALGLSPIITRLYGPEAYGLMGTIMAIISIITPIVALTFPIAIVLPEKEKEAKGLVQLSFLITFIFASISTILLLLFHSQIADIFKLKDLSVFLFFIPIVILCAGVLQVSEQWLIRTKQFHISANVSFFQSLITNGGKASIGLFYPAASVLIVFSSISQGIKALLIFTFSRQMNAKQFLFQKFELKFMKSLFKKYRDFPIYRSPEVFLNSISGSLPILLLTSLFGPISAGFYSVGRTVLGLPSQLIGKSVGDVFYPRVSEAANKKEKITPLILKATISLSFISAIPFGLIILFGPWLFSFVFGTDWSIAGEYARWMALSSYFVFINRPSVVSLPVLFAQKLQLNFTFISLFLRISVLIISYIVFKNDIVSVASYSIVNGILNVILILLTFKTAKKFENKNN